MPYRVRTADARVEEQLAALYRVRPDLFRAYERLIGGLTEAPRPRGCAQLDAGPPPIYRVWLGRDYRCLFAFDDSRQVVVITKIAKKEKKIYKRR